MIATSPAKQTGRTRRLFVTVVIATAAAAVTAGVALKERRPGEAVVQRAEASPALATGVAADASVQTRRGQWRDPWKRPAPLSESAPTSIHEPTDSGAALADPSLPAAGDALKGVSGATGESTPTF
jgi:hypothetical protein